MNKATLLQVPIYHLSGALIRDPFLYPEVEAGARCCRGAGADAPAGTRVPARAERARPGFAPGPAPAAQARRGEADTSESRAVW